MNFLPMDDATVARVRALAARAAERRNWYRPGPGVVVPGDNPLLREMVGSYKVVFSWSVDPRQGVVRHLTMSTVRGAWPGRLPHPAALFTVAGWLGFTGAPDGGDLASLAVSPPSWMVIPMPDHVVVGERIEPQPDAS